MKSVLLAVLTLTTFPNCFGQSSPQSVANLDLPHYPPIAHIARIEGQVRVELEVAPSGAITSAHVSGQQELLKAYVMRNVTTWRFQSSEATKPHSVKMNLTYEFKISGTSDQPFERVTFDRDRVLVETNPPEIDTSQTSSH